MSILKNLTVFIFVLIDVFVSFLYIPLEAIDFFQ